VEDYVEGYPQLAAFLDSDEGFMIYRRFGWLQTRLLLDKQEELRLLEEKLQKLDMREKKLKASTPMTRDAPPKERVLRKELLEKIELAFCSYCKTSFPVIMLDRQIDKQVAKLLVAAQQLVAFNKPSETDYRNVRQYMSNNQPLVEEEGTWTEWKEDIVTLRPGREHAWLDVGIERVFRFSHGTLIHKIIEVKPAPLYNLIDLANTHPD